MYPSKATIAPALFDEIVLQVGHAHHYAKGNSIAFRKLLRDAERLRQAEAYNGTVAEAWIHHWAGDLEKALHWLNNAKSYPGHAEEIAEQEAIFLSNLGFFSRARSVLLGFDAAKWHHSIAGLFILSACFGAVIARTSELPSGADEGWRDYAMKAQNYTAALQQLNISEHQTAALMDLAGEVLREHKMFFAGTKPFIYATDDSILLELAVQTSVEKSCAMTDEVIERMIDRNMDVPGLVFSFIPA